MLGRVTCYLSFLEHARCPGRGFHNFLSYQRDWLDAAGSGDCQGQAVRAWPKCSAAVCRTDYRALARELIEAVLPALADLRSLRAQAYVILAWGHLCGGGREGHRTARDRRLVRGAAAGGMLPPFRAAGLAVVRVANDLCQRGVAARPVRRRRALADEGFLDVAEVVVRLSRSGDDGRRTSSGRSETAIGIRTAKRRRCTTSSPWKPSRWPTPRWPRSVCCDEEKYLATFRRAHGWFHGENSLQTAAGRCRMRRLLRRPATTGRESESGSGIDARLSVDGIAQLRSPAVARRRSAKPTRQPRNSHGFITMHATLSRTIGMLRESKTPSLHTELFHRHADNPILTAQDWPYPAHTVFNAGACQVGDETILLVRVEDRRGHSHLTVARSNDGVSNWHIDSKPSFAPDPANFSEEAWGVEDPR